MAMTDEVRLVTPKERFDTVDDLQDRSIPYLNRIGALYLIEKQSTTREIDDRIFRLVREPYLDDRDEVLLSLHAATILARSGNFEGVDFILEMREKGDVDHRLVDTALRNCSEFPLAVLLAQSLDLEKVDGLLLKELMHITDAEFADMTTDDNADEYFRKLEAKLLSMRTAAEMPGRRLSIGTVITRPVRRDDRYRYSGFIAVDCEDSQPLVVPYDLGDVLNRNDWRAKQDILELLRRPGRRAVVIHDTQEPYTAVQLYVLPHSPAPTEEVVALMAKLSRSAIGLEITTVVSQNIDDRESYLAAAANGDYSINSYRPENIKMGNCLLLHGRNSEPLTSYLQLDPLTVQNIFRSFAETRLLDLGVVTGCFSFKGAEYHHIVELVTGESRRVFIRRTTTGNNDVEEASKVSEPDEVSEDRPDKAGAFAEPGSLAFIERDAETFDRGKALGNYRLESECPHCFGVGVRACDTCGGSGQLASEEINPDGGETCKACGGSGLCSSCDGTGLIETSACEDCRDGRCKRCGGTGQLWVSCPTCYRDGVVSCDCGGARELKIIGLSQDPFELLIELENSRASHPLIQPASDVWQEISAGSIIPVKVTRIESFGAFAEIARGVEGLIHISELAYKRVEKVSEILSVGDELDVKVLKVDLEKALISLSLKQLQENPALILFIKENPAGSVVEGRVTNITDFGAFVEVAEGVEGLVHSSELAWRRVEDVSEILSVGDQLRVKVIEVDRESERISLSLKAIQEKPVLLFIKENPAGSVVEGRVTNITDFGAFVEVAEGVEGLVHISELAWRRVEDVSEILSVGDQLRVKVIEVDRESERISLSLKQRRTP